MSGFLLGAGCFFCIFGVAVSYPDTIWLGLACFAFSFFTYLAEGYRADRQALSDAEVRMATWPERERQVRQEPHDRRNAA